MTRLLVLLPFALLVACNTNPTIQEAVDKMGPAICTKLQECNGAGFAAAYPGGVDDCNAKAKSAISQQYSDLNEHDACSDDEIDSCMKSLEAETCPADGSFPALPCNC